MKVTVHIGGRPEIADPEGTAISRSLVDLGYHVRSVRTGRTLHLEVDGEDVAAVEKLVDEMCQRLLTNPVIEDYRIEVEG